VEGDLENIRRGGMCQGMTAYATRIAEGGKNQNQSLEKPIGIGSLGIE